MLTDWHLKSSRNTKQQPNKATHNTPRIWKQQNAFYLRKAETLFAILTLCLRKSKCEPASRPTPVVLAGSTNRMNWKKPKQRQRNSLITTQGYKKPTTHEERTQKHFAPFLLRIVRKGKRNNNTHKNPQAHKNKQGRQEDKPRTTKTKPQKIGEEDEKRMRKR